MTTYEATKKYADTNPIVYLELCNRCERESDLPEGTVDGRADLRPEKGD